MSVASCRQKIAFRGISVNFRWSFPLNRGSAESVPMRPKSKSHTPPEAGHAPPLVFPCAPNPSPYAARGRTRPAISAQSQRLAVRMSSRRCFPMRPKSKPIRRQRQDPPRNQRPVPTPYRQGKGCGIRPTEDSLSGNFSELQVVISSEPWQFRKRSHAPQIQVSYAARGRTRPAAGFPMRPKSKPIRRQRQDTPRNQRPVPTPRRQDEFPPLVPHAPQIQAHTPPEAGHAPPLVSQYAARMSSPAAGSPGTLNPNPIRRQGQDTPRNQRPVPTPYRQGKGCGIRPIAP